MESKLPNIDIEDVEDILKQIEISYDIKFANAEMAHLKTFGEITDHIISKIELEENADCTSQQAFYKLREAISNINGIPKNEILPNTNLEVLIPRQRRKTISLIEKQLKVNIKAFYIPKYLVAILITFLFISIVALFFNWQYGLIGSFVCILLMKISDKTTTTFFDKTVGDLAKSMTYDNYIQSRRNSESVNRTEIKKNIKAKFIKELELSDLNDETVINY